MLFVVLGGIAFISKDDSGYSWVKLTQHVDEVDFKALHESAEFSLALGPGRHIIKNPRNHGFLIIPPKEKIIFIKIVGSENKDVGVYLITKKGGYLILRDGEEIPDKLLKNYSFEELFEGRVFKVRRS